MTSTITNKIKCPMPVRRYAEEIHTLMLAQNKLIAMNVCLSRIQFAPVVLFMQCISYLSTKGYNWQGRVGFGGMCFENELGIDAFE